MDSAASHASGSPLVGLAVAAMGAGGYITTTAVKMFLGAAELAQAATPSGSWTWDNITQSVTAFTVVAGIVMAWWMSQKQKFHDAEMARKKAEADAERERRREDAAAAREETLKDAMLRIQIEQATRHAQVCERLDRQDVALGISGPQAATPEATLAGVLKAAGCQDSRQEN